MGVTADSPPGALLLSMGWLGIMFSGIAITHIAFFIRSLVPVQFRLPMLLSKTRSLTSFGEWAVITGATDGIGKAWAIACFKKGMNVLLISRSSEKLAATKSEIEALGGKGVVDTYTLDLADAKDSDYAKLAHEKLTGKSIGILVNSAGVSYDHAMFYEEVPKQQFDALTNVNILSTLHISSYVFDIMKKQKKGIIVMLGSAASSMPSYPLYAGYSAAKGALEAFARSLKAECIKFPEIEIQCHLPLLVQTKMAKVKNSSLTVPSPAQYVASALTFVQKGLGTENPCVSPYPMHHIQTVLSQILPYAPFTKYMYSMTTVIRSKAMKKKQEQPGKKAN